MNRDYIKYVGEACENGMSAEEVRDLFSEIFKKTDTKAGKVVLKLFATGIGKTKKRSLQLRSAQQQMEQSQPQLDIPQMQKTFGVIQQ